MNNSTFINNIKLKKVRDHIYNNKYLLYLLL